MARRQVESPAKETAPFSGYPAGARQALQDAHRSTQYLETGHTKSTEAPLSESREALQRSIDFKVIRNKI